MTQWNFGFGNVLEEIKGAGWLATRDTLERIGEAVKKINEGRSPIELPLQYAAGPGVLNTVGIPQIATLTYNGAQIQSNVTGVTDIADPAGSGGWTPLVQFPVGLVAVSPFNIQFYAALNSHLDLTVASAEPAGNALRAQFLVDGQVVLDITVTGDGGTTRTQRWAPITYDGGRTPPLVCLETFEVRVARYGAFSSASSALKLGTIHIQRLGG
jgi:hypothetical protein